MIVTYWKGIFVVDKAESPTERSALKKAGFVLHEPTICSMSKPCKACRAGAGSRYWSDRVTAATRLRSHCNERALGAMKDHLDRLAQSRAVTSDIVVPCPRGFKLEPYQKAGVAYILTHKDTYLGDDMGLGKTVQALASLNIFRAADPKLNTLVLCPGNLDLNWKEETQKWLAVRGPKDLPEIIIPPSSSFEVPRRDNILVILNYEKVVRDSLLTDSLKRVWGVLICDEAQALKNWSSQRTRAVLGEEGLMQRAHRTIFLSGTPIENYPKEIWTIAASICPAKFGNWREFSERYCGIHRERGRVVDTGAANLAELQQRLRSSFMIRRLKKDVLKELPPKRRQLIVLGQSKVDWSKDPDFARWKELYERDYETKLAALEAARTDDEYKRAARKLDTFTGVAFEEMADFRHKTAMAKLPACIEYVDQLLKSGLDKLVIFAHHQEVLQTLAAHYGDAAVSLHGEVKKRDRWPIIKSFQDGSKRIFIGGLKAAGVGLNLFAASTVVFIEIDWNPATLTQAEDRLCRMGQKKMVHVIHLIMEGTLDANIARRVVEKQNVVDKALNFLPEHGMPKTAPRQLELGVL